MRQRLDLGTLLQALGAILLLISLFLDWYSPGGQAWRVFEIVDLLLAALAVAVIVAAFSRLAAGEGGSPGWLQGLGLAALVIVAVELVDKPPAVRGSDLDTGAWLALGAAVLMAVGALLHRASISISIDVRERDRRRRVPAVDRRTPGAEPVPGGAARRRGAAASEDDLGGSDTQRTQPLRPIRDDDEAP